MEINRVNFYKKLLFTKSVHVSKTNNFYPHCTTKEKINKFKTTISDRRKKKILAPIKLPCPRPRTVEEVLTKNKKYDRRTYKTQE